MNTKKGGLIIYYSAFAFILIADRLLKWAVELDFFENRALGWKNFGLERFHNLGIAFNIPIPLWSALIGTFFVISAIIFWLNKPQTKQTNYSAKRFAALIIISGALSNAYDRLMYGYTIDYLRILHSVVNFADIIIVAGILLIFYKRRADKIKQKFY